MIHDLKDSRRSGSVLAETVQRMLKDQREANENLIIAALLAVNEADEAAVAQARAEVTAAELQISERELLDAAAFREQLLGIVGHDLKNPLNGMLMAAGLLQMRGNLTSEDEDVVARMLRSGWRMNRMVAQLLQFTRARLGGGFILSRAPIDLGQVCTEILDELSLSPKVEIRRELEGDLTGNWDTDLLAEVLSNIVGNAVAYATPRTVILVRAWGDRAEVSCEISNEGPPIPPELMPVLFSPFRRGQIGERAPAGNLGLGLYIAHEVVQSHGGTIMARSAEGTTTFTVRLPRALGAQGAQSV